MRHPDPPVHRLSTTRTDRPTWLERRPALAVVLAILLTLVACSAAGATATRDRLWHGMGIENLQAPTTLLVSTAADPNLTGPVSAEHPGTMRLSNETTLTRWANSVASAVIYQHPDAGARRVARLHLFTEDGFPEVYVLLAQYTDRHGQVWVRLRIPARPNGRTGWVRRNTLGPYNTSRWLLVINRRAERLTAYRNGRRVLSAPVGVGKPSTPTPTGHFWIRERFRVPAPASPYFPDAIGTSDYSTLSDWPGGGVVGIHGDWHEPWLIPGHPSHGCVRMHNRDIAWLALRVPVGTPIHIS